MTRFRPCIDLHEGKVKQIVGSTLSGRADDLETNFESDQEPAYYADLYRRDGLRGGHVIMLGAGNEAAALAALAAYPGGLQVGGGINAGNAAKYLEAGASHVIVTSWLFSTEGKFLPERLVELNQEVGRERLVIDLSCRASDSGWVVAMNRWQTLTDLPLTQAVLDDLGERCDEFLIHAADVEGKCEGVDSDLVRVLGAWGKLPITYAGGASALDDLGRVNELSGGKVDLTIGSALDLFGGTAIRYEDCVEWNQRPL